MQKCLSEDSVFNEKMNEKAETQTTVNVYI